MLQSLALLISTTPLTGPEQMALDEVLLRNCTQPLLRFYSWKEPCVTFGYFQKWATVQKAYPDFPLARRWSGGGCVEHLDDITFALFIPASDSVGKTPPSLFYRKLHQNIVAALQKHQINAHLARPEEICRGESCFIAPSPCDVMLDRKKIVGGAQRRCGGALLHQGSIAQWKQRGLEWNTFKKTFSHSLATQLSLNVTRIEEKELWMKQAVSLSKEKYETPHWNKKR